MDNQGGTIARLSQSTRRSTSTTTSIGSPSPYRRDQYHDQNLTTSSFDPDHESTQNIAPFSPNPQGQDESLSVELGRGATPSLGRHGPIYTQDDSLYDLTGLTLDSKPSQITPKYKSLGAFTNKPTMKRSTTMPTSHSKTPDARQPTKMRSASANARRSLSAVMHAKLQTDVTTSIMEDINQQHHPAGQLADARSNLRRPAARHAVPTRFTVAGGLERKIDDPSRRPVVGHDHAANTTAHSFMLPDLPNIAELVSGVRKDGSPVFSKFTKGRSRFTSATYERQDDVTVTDHARVVSLPLPEDEKLIFASLQVLKDRVAELEAENARGRDAIDQYANENAKLKSQLDTRPTRRGEARADSGHDAVELKASLRATQDRLSRAELKITQSRAAVDRMTSERDGLVTQLGVAFYTNEELKSNNCALHEEQDRLIHLTEELQNDKSHAMSDLEDAQHRLAQTCASLDKLNKMCTQREAELRKRISRRDKTIAELRESGRDVSDDDRDVKVHEPANDRPQNHMSVVERQIRKAQRQAARRPSQKEHAIQKSKSAPSRSRSRSKSQGRRMPDKIDRVADFELQHADNAADQESDSDVDSVLADLDLFKTREPQTSRHPHTSFEEADNQDLTYLSFLDPNEVSRLRKQLEDERRAAKSSRMAAQPATKPSIGARKSSLKDLSSKALDGEQAINLAALRNVRIQTPQTSDAISLDHFDNSSKTLQNDELPAPAPASGPEPEFEEMTSAFLIPDVTISAAATTATTNKNPSPHAASTTPHEPSPTDDQSSPSVLPVSKRRTNNQATEADIDASTATQRPSTLPSKALSSVIKQLEAQLATTKKDLETLEKQYNSHDPALGRRKRVELKSDIERLLAVVEERSEVVYRLYDVVEGI